MLIIAACSVVGFVLLYADPSERAVGQGMFIGGVTAVVVSSLLSVALLASPFQGGHGAVHPKGMQYTITLIEAEAPLLHDPLATPCDKRGNPVTARSALRCSPRIRPLHGSIAWCSARWWVSKAPCWPAASIHALRLGAER
jgi:hypothetical protein